MLDKMYNPDPQIITTKTYYFTFKASTKEEVDYLVKVLNNHDEYFSFSELHKYVEEKLPDGVILQSRASLITTHEGTMLQAVFTLRVD